MATTAQPLSPSSRQPFAVLGDARLRALGSVKNAQNGVASTSLKRRYDASDLSDSENVDPASTASATKRQKNSSKQDSCESTSGFTLVTKSQSSGTPIKNFNEQSPFTAPTSISTPKSAPLRASTGRSSKSRVSKAFARRNIGSHVRHMSIPAKSRARAPFSISDALNGTFTAPQSKVARRSSASGVLHKKSWDFDIYVDTEEEEAANLMEHSTSTLDISDDENTIEPKDGRGKENIPPNELAGSLSTRITSRQRSVVGSPAAVEMIDDPRAPLGELNPKNFVPDGVNPSDSVPVAEDDQEGDIPSKKPICSQLSVTETVDTDKPTNAPHEQPHLISDTAIKDIISNSAPSTKEDTIYDASNATHSSNLAFDTWESDSATEEAAAGPALGNC